MRVKSYSIAALAILASMFMGCGTSKDIGGASEAVTTFHARLDNGDFSTIYAQADPRFRTASSQKDFIDLMAAIHRKLGKVSYANRQGFFVNWDTSGTRVRLTYATKFTEGDAQEEFVWAKAGDRFALLGYNINSNTLIVK
jgi:Protein of unknown function (DUF4019)